jgi:phenylpropionate dioxygenase-like ring-hydroxylating dioxygenase large terminal subunit
LKEDIVKLAHEQRRPKVHGLRRVGAHPDHWYPVAWTPQVRRGKTLAVQFAGEPIVLVRTKSGALFALEDRCAHRQVPLHAGVVAGETLRCCYHGWTYDGSGRCVGSPYMDKDELPYGVRAYPCAERHGLVFVFPGAPAKAASRPLPELNAAADRQYKTRRFGQDVRCHYTFMHENLMDMNHQFLHRRQMGQMRTTCLATRNLPDSLEVDYVFARMAGKQPLGEAAIFGSKRGAAEDVMTVRTQYPYQTLHIRSGDDAPVMDLWIAYVPQDREQRINRTFGLLSIRKPRLPGALHLAWPFICWFTNRIFAEDRWVVEREQEAHDRQDGDWNQEVFPVIRELRALLERCGAPMDAAPDRDSMGRESTGREGTASGLHAIG